MCKILFSILLIIGSVMSPVYSAVRLHAVFSDHMVLQRDLPIRIWGWADAGKPVLVTFKGLTKKTYAAKNTSWEVIFPPSAFGGPYQLSVVGSERVELRDILVGDVWICAGQSNMDMGVSGANHAEAELKDIKYPGIRLFTVPQAMSSIAQDTMAATSWVPCNTNTVSDFSAVGYFFGRELHRDLNIPVGLIKCSWSGTNIQTWISGAGIAAFSQYDSAIRELRSKDYKDLTRKRDRDYTLWMDTLINLEPGTKYRWHLPHIDDSGWYDVSTPFVWSSIGLKGNGVGWFRKEFDLTKEEAAHSILFMLGKIQTGEEVYLNGNKIGDCNSADRSRIYAGAPELLKDGKNVIAIKLYNEWGDGGFAGRSDEVFLQTYYAKRPFSGSWKFKPGHLSLNPVLAVHPNNYPTLLYNGMVNPLVKFAVKGIVWYQGENNSDEPDAYKRLLPAFITDWRKQWKLNLPFLIVQIPNFMHDGDMPPAYSNWAMLREAQMSSLNLHNTGLAVTIDLGDPDNVHPGNKQDVAHRVTLLALKIVYDKDVIASGPTFKSLKIHGNKAIIQFDNTGSGLVSRNKYNYVRSFAIAGADHKFYWAKAAIRGTTVEVSSEKVNRPVAVRYAWSFSPDIDLYNTAGLPARPFRTDE